MGRFVDADGQREGQDHDRSRRWYGRRCGSGQIDIDEEEIHKRSKTVTGVVPGAEQFPSSEDEPTLGSPRTPDAVEVGSTSDTVVNDKVAAEEKRSPGLADEPLPIFLRHETSGYIDHPKLPRATSTAVALRAFWKWVLTPMGFLIMLYGLNVVAWGGMLFLLLCNASPAMCHPTCNDINSPRRKWIEWDSQILNLCSA